jgi:hypothetical protein
MSDGPQGPDWWQASDDKWYPPPRPPAPGEDATIPQIEVPPDPTLVQAPATPPPVAPPTAPVPPTAPPYVPPQPPPTSPYGAPTVPSVPSTGPMATPPPSPYGQPAMPPTGSPSPNRVPLIITLVVVVALVIGAAVVIATGDDEPSANSSTTTAPSGPTTSEDGPDTSGDDPSSSTTTGGGGGGGTETEPPYTSGHEDLEIVDQGFSVSDDESTGAETLTYGALIENHSDRVAVICSIVTTFNDEDGSEVASHGDAWLSAIMPGQTFGIGISQIDVSGEPAAMHVELGTITYDDPANYGEITVDVGDTTVDSYGRPTTTYTAESGYAETLPGPFAWVVHRNADGDIVGGDGAYLDGPLDPGQPADDEVTTRGAIADVDESQAEVWIEPVTTDCLSDQPGEPPDSNA